MKGFPKFINTRKDVENLLQLYPERTKKYLQNALAEYEGWVSIVSQDNKEGLVEDKLNKIIELEGEDGVITFVQQKYMVVPGITLDRLGITKEEAEGGMI